MFKFNLTLIYIHVHRILFSRYFSHLNVPNVSKRNGGKINLTPSRQRCLAQFTICVHDNLPSFSRCFHFFYVQTEAWKFCQNVTVKKKSSIFNLTLIYIFAIKKKICEAKMVDTIYNLRPRRPPFFLVASEGIGVTSSIRPIFIPEM